MRRRVHLLVWKEFTQLRRDPMLIRLLLLLPVAQLLLFGYVVAADIRDLSTAVVDLDNTAASRTLTQAFTGSGYFTVVARPSAEDELRPLLDRGEAMVGLVIPVGTADLLSRGEPAPIGVVVDGSDSQVSAVASGYAAQIVGELNARMAASRGMPASAPGVDARIRVLFDPSLDPVVTMVPGLIGVIMMLSLTVIMSQAVVKERESGTLEQMFVTPIRPAEYLIGKVTPYALMATAQMLLVAAGALWWFKVPFTGDVWALLVGLALFMATNIGLGLLVSLISHTRQQAQQATMFIMIPTMVLSGYIFPIQSMPEAIQPLSNLFPMTFLLEVVRGTFVRGVGFSALVGPLLVLAGFATVIFSAAIVATRRRIAE